MFKRIGDAIRGLFDFVVGGFERRHPQALLELAKEDFRDQMASLQAALSKSAARSAQLKAEVREAEAEADRLAGRISEEVQAGRTVEAGELALALEPLQQEISAKKEQLAGAEASYRKTLDEVPEVQTRFRKRIEQLERRLSEVKLKEALADATSAASGVGQETGEVAESLARVDQVLKERAAQAEGALRAAQAVAATRDAVEQEKRKAQGAQALAQFLAARGQRAPEAPKKEGDAPPRVEKTIGPRTS